MNHEAMYLLARAHQDAFLREAARARLASSAAPPLGASP